MSDTSGSKRRSLWPAGILVAFAVFVAGTAGLVVLSARNNVELVRPDYYEQELRYQQQINRRKRTQALHDPARVSYDAGSRQITIALPHSHAARAEGEIQLYRPSSAGMDRRMKLQLDTQGQQTLDAATLTAGLWRVRLTWRMGGEEFFSEHSITVQPAQL